MRRTTAPPAPPLRLALLLYPGCMPAGLFATADLARAANLRAQRPVITTCWAGADLQPVPTWEGPALTPSVALAQAEVDAVLVPGLWLSSPDGLQAPQQQQHIAPAIAALRALPRRTQVWSYCAGVALAAASGRMRGRGATATRRLRGPPSWLWPTPNGGARCSGCCVAPPPHCACPHWPRRWACRPARWRGGCRRTRGFPPRTGCGASSCGR